MSNVVESVRVLMSLIDRVTAPARAIVRSLDGIAAPARRAKLALQAMMETRGMKRAMAGIEGIGSRVRSLAGHAAGLAAPLAAVFSGGSIVGLLNAAHAASEYADSMMDAATSAGISFEAFQALNHVAEQGGVSTQTLGKSFKFLNKQIGAAKAGVPHAQEMFDALGISADDLAKLEPDKIFLAVAGALEKITDPSLKVSAALAVFGKSGDQLLPMMDEGTAAMEGMIADAMTLGIVMDQKSGKAVKDYADHVAKLMSALQGLSRAIAANIVPALDPLVEKLTKWIAANRELIATQLGEFVQRIGAWIQQIDFKRVLEGMNNFIAAIQQVIGWLGGWDNAGILAALGMTGLLGPLLSILTSLVPALWAAIPAVVSFGAALMTTPIGWVIAGIAALAAAVYLIYDNWEEISQWLLPLWDSVKTGFFAFVDAISGKWSGISEWFSASWDRIKTGFLAFVDWMAGAVKNLLSRLDAPLRAVAGLFGFEIPKFDFGGTASILAASNAPPASSDGLSALTQPSAPAKAQIGGEMVVRFENPPPGMEVTGSRSDSPGLSFRPDLGLAFGSY